jgi:hypothetical protein
MRSAPRWKQSAEPRRVDVMTAEAQPIVPDAAQPVDAPVEPDENARLRARIAVLEAELRQARQPETPKLILKPLKAAASLAGVPRETARRWCANNRVTARRVGKLWYTDDEELRAQKKQQRMFAK